MSAGRAADAALGYPITRHGAADSIVATRAGRLITRDEFLRDIAALAVLLPAHAYIINLCADRYRFAVGFAAALCRRQISLLPPGEAPGVLAAIAADFPDVFVLTDHAPPPGLPFFSYPEHLAADVPADIPLIPGLQPALILFTSGSTGRPAPVPKTWSVLVHSALAAGARLGIGAAATVIGTVPHQHSYGLESTILLALQHGLTIASGALFYPADIRAALEAARRPTILVTTPVHLKTLVAEPGGMPQTDLIVSATAPLTAALAAQAEVCFGAALIEIYGCTEAGQVATRRTSCETAWRCLDGVTLHHRDGRTTATGPAVEGTALLQDFIEPITADAFHLGGRTADLVDVAGKRTSLAYLTHLLLSIEGVEDGIFYMSGQQSRAAAHLAAMVVAPGLRPEDIRAALRRLTDPAFCPRPLTLVDALPRNALGKVPREALLHIGRAE